MYFNDGEAVYYQVYLRDLTIDGEKVDADELWYANKETPLADTLKELEELTSKIPEGFLLEVFGDHKRLYITRSNIEVEDYTDHD
jgi:hypothetical protein